MLIGRTSVEAVAEKTCTGTEASVFVVVAAASFAWRAADKHTAAGTAAESTEPGRTSAAAAAVVAEGKKSPFAAFEAIEASGIAQAAEAAGRTAKGQQCWWQGGVEAEADSESDFDSEAGSWPPKAALEQHHADFPVASASTSADSRQKHLRRSDPGSGHVTGCFSAAPAHTAAVRAADAFVSS